MSIEVKYLTEDIKPQLTVNEAVTLSNKLYGLNVVEALELASYDDRNYHIVDSTSSHGFVLKIVNSNDSKSVDFFDAQNALLLVLREKNFAAPTPRKTLLGSYHSLEELPFNNGTRSHLVKLFDYLPGKLFKNVPGSMDLYYQVGVWTAQLDVALKDFRHPGIENHKTKWHMNFIPYLHPYISVVKDPARKAIVVDVVDEFSRKVASASDELRKGIIHGDINEQNLLVDSTLDGGWNICAVLDFGDANLGCYLYEVAAAVCYMMLDGPRTGLNPMKCGAATLAGYMSVFPLNSVELSLLKVTVCARLCQSLVFGLCTHAVLPDNTYILATQENGWEILSTTWGMTDADVARAWSLQSYQ